MILVVQVDIRDAELELHLRPHVRRGLRLDDSFPYNWADAFVAHQHADHQAAVGLELHIVAGAREAGIFGIEVLALIRAIPQRGAAVVGIKLLLHRGAER